MQYAPKIGAPLRICSFYEHRTGHGGRCVAVDGPNSSLRLTVPSQIVGDGGNDKPLDLVLHIKPQYISLQADVHSLYIADYTGLGTD